MRTALQAALAVIRREPVAAWGVVLAAVLAALPAAGVSAETVTLVGAAASLLGVPLVRGRVTPADALKALLDGADGKLDDRPFYRVGRRR